VTVGTFSKVFAVIGGFVAASRPLIQYLRFFNRSYMFSTSLPPPVVGAILGGLDVLERDRSPLDSLRANVRYLRGRLRDLGHEVSGDETPIIPLRVPPEMDMRVASKKFEERGIFINSIEFPAVPISKQQFRISVMATHRQEDLDSLIGAVEEVWSTCRLPEVPAR
jgi:glycine C-acetyltransferase